MNVIVVIEDKGREYEESLDETPVIGEDIRLPSLSREYLHMYATVKAIEGDVVIVTGIYTYDTSCGPSCGENRDRKRYC